MNFKLVLASVLVGLVVLFVVQNIAIVEINFLFWSMSFPRSLLMGIMLVIGIIVGWILHSHFEIKRK